MSDSLLAKRVFFALKKTRASGRNVGKVFNPVVQLVLENQPFLMQIQPGSDSLTERTAALSNTSTSSE